MTKNIKLIFDILFSDGNNLSKEIIPLYLDFLFSDCPDEIGERTEGQTVEINHIYDISHIEFGMEIDSATTFQDVLEEIFNVSGIKKSVFFRLLRHCTVG